MTTIQILNRSFDELGIEVSDAVIEKCIDMCISYAQDPCEFAETLVAFVATNNSGADLTVAILDEFERKELSNSKTNAHKTPKTQRNIERMEYDDGSDGEGDDVMGAYICTTPKTKKPQSRMQGISTPVSALTTPVTIESPISVPLKDNTGKVVYTFGTSQLMKSINWTNNTKQTIKFDRVSETFSADQPYMYDNLLQKTSIAADRIFDIGDEICTKLIKEHSDVYDNDLRNDVFKMGDPSQSVIKCVGRICSDSDCQLDMHSTLLISADEICLRSYRLKFDRMKSVGLFPGQTVFMQGINPRGDTFFVDELTSDHELNYADPPTVTENLNIIVAAGPFTGQQDLNYEPLGELLAYCKQHKPDVLILMGPFIDADHPRVLDGLIKGTFESYFEAKLLSIVNNISTDTEIFVVASSQDVHSTSVYPTAPYTWSQSNKNVTFLPDPCIIKLNGVTIGMTATDIYNHILEAEIAVNAGDRVKRIANHLFNQASFYPLNPSSDKVSVDSVLLQQFATLPIVPNILILKSASKCFAREVKRPHERGCLVLNPGSMYETSANGTFSRLIVTPTTDDESTAPLNSIIGCQIIKI